MAVGISVTQEQNLNRHRAFGPTGEALDGTELRAHQHVGRVGGWGFGLPGGQRFLPFEFPADDPFRTVSR